MFMKFVIDKQSAIMLYGSIQKWLESGSEHWGLQKPYQVQDFASMEMDFKKE